MISREFTIKNKMGLHMRPVQGFVTDMAKFQSDITIRFNDKVINGKSIMMIMAACIKCGAKITVECSGADEEAMMAKVTELVESGFGEE